MKKARILWAMALLLGVTAMQAQTSDVEAWKGVRLSYDHVFMSANTINSYGGTVFDDMGGLDGTTISYYHAFKLTQKYPMFIEVGAGLNFAIGAYKADDFEESTYSKYSEELKYKLSTFGMTIPVNYVYAFKLNNDFTFKPYTGFYFRFNFLAKGKLTSNYSYSYDYSGTGNWETEEENYEEKINLYDKEDVGSSEYKWKACQVGWQIGLTADYKKFNLGLGYGVDFNPVQKNTYWGLFSVRLGYNF